MSNNFRCNFNDQVQHFVYNDVLTLNTRKYGKTI